MDEPIKSKRRFWPGTIAFILIILFAVSPSAFAATMPKELVPVGKTVGINISCEGVMVVSLNAVETAAGNVSPAKDAGMLPGDIITHVGADEVETLNDFRTAVDKTEGDAMTIRFTRGDNEMQVTLQPVKNENGHPELGIWLRDGLAGIGTVTFYDPQSGKFGALGHSVTDVETGSVVPLESGTIMPAKISSIIKGASGSPGELQGEFDFDKSLGAITENTSAGIFGKLEDASFTDGGKAYPVGSEDDLKLGPATILADINGEGAKEYAVEISRIFTGGDNRKMMVTVTDETLLEATGGIVQGMSGSPIIQNDKIVGAVTHVLIDNPQKGYGISISRMLETAFSDSEQNAA